jgi:ribosomal protein S21
MLIVKVEKNVTIEKALKIYKSKVIKTRQSKELNERKEFQKNPLKGEMRFQKRNTFRKNINQIMIKDSHSNF